MERRTVIKWVLAAAASPYVVDSLAFGARAVPTTAQRVAGGYGPDPDILRTYKPGDLWALTMTAAQRATTTALCDVIIPADSGGPAASAVGVPAFIDEWISAPYPGHDADRRIILEGLAALDADAQARFGGNFTSLSAARKLQLCEELSQPRSASQPFRRGAPFFKRFRDLTAGGYYTTPEGMKDLGYVGNRPLVAFDGPPADVRRKVGLE